MQPARRIHRLLGSPGSIGIEAWDGSAVVPPGRAATIRVVHPRALARIARAPGELGVVRAYVSGDIDVDGDIEAVLALAFGTSPLSLRASDVLRALLLGGPSVWSAMLQTLPPPPEEARVRGRLHSTQRDAAAISHHYDLSNEFYELVLGSAMTYSCAVFDDPADALADAQTRKHELVATKLDLQPGMRLLDIGCGWGQMLVHAARHHGVHGVGVTLSQSQAQWARAHVAAHDLEDRIDIRLLDYRELGSERFDAISSIGMFEHVGRAEMGRYMRDLHRFLRPGGRVLHHAIARPVVVSAGAPIPRWRALQRQVLIAMGSDAPSRIDSPLMQRYVFPDGELHALGTMVDEMQDAALEVRDVENLREHYALTLRHWVRNLRTNWDAACALVGEPRARIWELYMAACALGFEHHHTEVHQILAVRPTSVGAAAYPLRPAFRAGTPVGRTGIAAAAAMRRTDAGDGRRTLGVDLRSARGADSHQAPS